MSFKKGSTVQYHLFTTFRSAKSVTETMKQTDSYVKETLDSYLHGLEISVAEVGCMTTCVTLFT